MSNTFNTNKAREARMLNDSWLDKFNSGDRAEINKISSQLDSIQINGQRFGNKRKHEAALKVLARRSNRAKLNREIEFE